MKFRTLFLTILSAIIIDFCIPTASADNATPARIVFLGDSNLWIGGDDCKNPKGWNKYFADLFQGSCRSFARSGATWSHTSKTDIDTLENIGVLGPRNVILNQTERLRGFVARHPGAAPDIVVIAAGTNDAWFHKKRPGLFTDTVSLSSLPSASLLNLPPGQILSLRDAIRLNCTLLRSFLPNARIVLLSPLQSTAVNPSILRQVSDIISRTASDLGVEFLPLDSLSPIRAGSERKQRRLTSDGTHTSPEGARLTGQAVFHALFPDNR